jgi:hypothetical protein
VTQLKTYNFDLSPSPTDYLYPKMGLKSYCSHEIPSPTADPDGIPFFIFGSHVMHIWSTRVTRWVANCGGPLLFPHQHLSLDTAWGRRCDLLDDHGEATQFNRGICGVEPRRGGVALLEQRPNSAAPFSQWRDATMGGGSPSVLSTTSRVNTTPSSSTRVEPNRSAVIPHDQKPLLRACSRRLLRPPTLTPPPPFATGSTHPPLPPPRQQRRSIASPTSTSPSTMVAVVRFSDGYRSLASTIQPSGTLNTLAPGHADTPRAVGRRRAGHDELDSPSWDVEG